MILTFKPQKNRRTLTLERSGDTLIVNGEPFDFTDLGEGEILPRNAISGAFFAGSVRRVGGVLQIPMVLPFTASRLGTVSAPAPIVNPPDGPIALPEIER